jgi:hypothetical protein
MAEQSNITSFKGYNGNPNIKRSGIAVDWTPDLVSEYMKCSQDVVYFTEKYMKIINVDKGLISFKLYPYQKEMLKSMADNRYTVIGTARQAGKSTTTCAFILWYIIFHAEKTVALLANKGDTAREILGRIQLAYQHLPKWLQQGVVEWNKGSFELENNSRVIAGATSADSIRGYSINMLFIDEAAFIDNWDEFFTSVFPTVSSGQTTKIVLVSTPNGLNHFYKTWVGAEEGRNGYNPIKVVWQDVPGRDEEWMKNTLAAMNNDTEKFAQEYCVEFLGSSGTLIDGWKLKELVYQQPVAYHEGLYQYKRPERGRNYVLVVDVSRGKGLDYSAFQVIDITGMPYEQVCTYRSNTITPMDYADVVNRIGKIYNSAGVLVEINDIGEQVSTSLQYDFEYDNLLYTESFGRSGKRITTGFGGGNADRGVRTTKSVKAIGCSMLKMLVEQNQLIINDFNTINELSTFSRKAQSYEAEAGCHDDLVMPLVLFGWMSDQNYFKDFTNINTLMKLREKSDEDLLSELMPFGFMDFGSEEIDSREVIDGDEGNWLLR